MGVLLGQQEGKVLEVVNSLEISYAVTPQGLVIDEAFLARRLEAYKKMFPNLDCLGWYSTGSA